MPSTQRLLLLASILTLALHCKGPDATRSDAPPARSVSSAAPAQSVAAPGPPSSGLTCVLQVSSSTGNRYGVSLALTNADKTPVRLRYFHPIGFALKAWVDGKPVTLRIPATDSPVMPRELLLKPGATKTISTPMSLSFGPGSRDADQKQPHRLWLDHPPTRVRLLAERAFASHKALTCTGHWVGTE